MAVGVVITDVWIFPIFSARLFLHYEEQVILMIETIIDSIAVALEDPFKIFIFVFSTTTENVKLK